jgi:hypothetical protein
VNRALGAVSLALLMLFGVQPGLAVAAPPGSVSWVVDQHKKTITVTVRLQIYSACSGDLMGTAEDQAKACAPGASSQVTQLLADKIRQQAEKVWNKPYRYRCYKLIVRVDVKIAADKSHVEPGRVAVRIDPSPAGIRDYVGGTGSRKYLSNDPADRFDSSNDGKWETTWGEQSSFTAWVYAHELGHVMGLDDAYHDTIDPVTGKVISVPFADAPLDLMSTGQPDLTQDTINRLVERNGDQLVDTDGNKLDLNELVCEPQFLAKLTGDQQEYDASNFMNSARSCPSPATTTSNKQTLNVVSENVEVRVVDAPELQPLGYLLVPSFDVLTLQNGLTGGGRGGAAAGLFDLPVTVGVDRSHHTPATGPVPQLLDFKDSTCAGGNDSTPPPADCGRRSYPAWLAMNETGNDDLWPISSSLPVLLKDLGYQSVRLDKLYKNCPGKTPWPGLFVDEAGGTKVPGKLPPLATLTKVYFDWATDGIAGKIEIKGSADLQYSRPGTLINDYFDWTLTMCPLNKDGQPPPGCP